LNVFEGLIKHLFAEIKGIHFDKAFPRMTYDEAMHSYGSDKPDLRFGMKFQYLNALQGKGFAIFDSAESVINYGAERFRIHPKAIRRTYRMAETTTNRGKGIGLC